MARKKQNSKRLETRLQETVQSFENIRLEIDRSDLDEKDHKDRTTIYLLGKKGEILAQSNLGKKLELVGNRGAYNSERAYIWGCVKPVYYKRLNRWIIDPSSFTIMPTCGYTPIEPHGLWGNVDLRDELHRRILSFRPLDEKDFSFIEKARIKRRKERRKKNTRKNNLRKIIPKVGQEIYLPHKAYISHGEDDQRGGLATITKVWKENENFWITVKEVPRAYNWSDYLALDQDKWKKKYGDQRARPDPDLRPQFNKW